MRRVGIIGFSNLRKFHLVNRLPDTVTNRGQTSWRFKLLESPRGGGASWLKAVSCKHGDDVIFLLVDYGYPKY